VTRELTDYERRNLAVLQTFVTDIAFLYLTPTGLGKAILDAVLPVRTLLQTHHIHNFNDQPQGDAYKVEIQAAFLDDECVSHVTTSLYRPVTKKGDPRIWFSCLKQRAHPNDILALFVFNNTLYALNLTLSRLAAMRDAGTETETTSHLLKLTRETLAPANHLLAKLRVIAASGPLAAICSGDTAIGRTVETALGIKINSSRTPDYNGIELKSSRTKSTFKTTANRAVLFAQVPDWAISRYKSSRELLEAFGYDREGGLHKLYCTVAIGHPNSQGLQLKLLRDQRRLAEIHVPSSPDDVVAWRLDTLHERLNEKHHETFWIGADTFMRNNREHFILKTVRHTRNPSIAQFDNLLEKGCISVDHLIKRTVSGGAREKGPLFKLPKKEVPSLFLAETREYTL
jgi:hypothetical protein